MTRRGRLTTLPVLSRLAKAFICLSAVAFLAIPQTTVPSCCAESAEEGCPCQENGNSAENELVACSSARHRVSEFRDHTDRQPREATDRPDQLASGTARLPAVVGHRLANGVSAPLLN